MKKAFLVASLAASLITTAQDNVKQQDRSMMIPMLASVEMHALPAPGQGALVYNKTEQGFWFYDGSTWRPLLTAEPAANGQGITWHVQRTGGKDVEEMDGAPKLTSGTSGFWDLTGNVSTDPTINFIGTTDNEDVVFRTNNVERVRISGNNGRVGINTLAGFSDLLTVEGTSTGVLQGISVRKFDASGAAPTLRLEHARGTPTSPSGSLAGDDLGALRFHGHTSLGFAAGADITALAAENFTSNTTTGSRLMLRTSPSGSGGLIPRVIIDQNGNTGIGTDLVNLPVSLLHVRKGGSNITPSTNTVATFENSANPAYLSLLTVGSVENGLLFGNNGQAIGSAIIYGNSAAPTGLQFRTGGNFTRMTLDQNGRLGVNALTPLTRVDITGGLTVRRPATIVLVGGTNTVTVGDNSYLLIQGATGAVLNLSSGLSTGQLLHIEGSGTAFTITDSNGASNCNLASDRSLGTNDTLTLIWDGFDWLELAFSNN